MKAAHILNEIVQSHSNYLNDSVKKPVVKAPGPRGLKEVIQEDVEVRITCVLIKHL